MLTVLKLKVNQFNFNHCGKTAFPLYSELKFLPLIRLFIYKQ